MIGESITAGKSIKSYGKVSSMLSMFHKIFQKYAHKVSRLSFVSTSLSSTLEMISLITSASIIFVGIILITKNYNLSSGNFVILFSYSGIFMNNIKNIVLVYKDYQDLKSDQYQLFEILKAKPYKSAAQNHVISESIIHMSVQPIQISIDKKEILHLKKEISLSPNASICILGKTGRGKTTLLEIIAGLTQKKDAVYINNIDIYQLSSEYITNNIWEPLFTPFGKIEVPSAHDVRLIFGNFCVEIDGFYKNYVKNCQKWRIEGIYFTQSVYPKNPRRGF